MKMISRVTVVAGYAGVLMFLVVAMSPSTASPAQAQSPVVTTLAIDMVIDDDGDTIPDNDDHTVGNIDRCIQVAAGGTVEFDVVLDAVPAGRNFKGQQYFMGFDSGNLTFVSQQHVTNCPPPNGLNMICRAANSCTGLLGCLYTGEGVPEPPDSGDPASPGVHDVFVLDASSTATISVGGASDPFGSAGGLLGRYEMTVSATAPGGVYEIGLNDSVVWWVILWDNEGHYIWDVPGNGVDDDDDDDDATDEDIMLDKTAGYGIIAVDVTCSDTDGDGYWNIDEADKGSDPLDPSSTPEHCDGVDNDGDDPGDGSGVDEGFPDSDGDTIKDCVDPDHPYYTDDDDDDDGFTDVAERCMTTDEQDACPDDSNPWGAEEDDAWPPDINADTVVDVTDVLKFLVAFPSAPWTANYSRRLDMADCPAVIDITDALVFLLHFPSACTNP